MGLDMKGLASKQPIFKFDNLYTYKVDKTDSFD